MKQEFTDTLWGSTHIIVTTDFGEFELSFAEVERHIESIGLITIPSIIHYEDESIVPEIREPQSLTEWYYMTDMSEMESVLRNYVKSKNK